MKVTNVTTHLVHPGRGKNWLFIKIETDESTHGGVRPTHRPTATKPSNYTVVSHLCTPSASQRKWNPTGRTGMKNPSLRATSTAWLKQSKGSTSRS
jgi:hypothetical protein